MRVFITGVTGMAGSHLAEYLLSRGDVELYGLYRWRSRMDNLDDMKSAGQLNILAEGWQGSLDALVAERTGVQTMIAHQFASMSLASRIKPQLLSSDAPSLMITCGLAMRSFDT